MLIMVKILAILRGGGGAERAQLPAPLSPVSRKLHYFNMRRSYAIFSDSLFTYLFEFRTVVIRVVNGLNIS